MNTPNRPHEELDTDERELARVVRALPGNEPPPALDLRILRAAQDAVASTSQKRTRRTLWASSAAGSFLGFGTAAAAVLAVGISWQLFMRGPTSNLPTSGPAVIAENGARDRDATPVDFVGAPEASKDATGQLASAAAAPAASPPTAQLQQRATMAEPMREESKPADAPHPFIDEHVAAANEARTSTGQPVVDLQRVEVTGSRIKRQETDALQTAADARDDAAAADSAMADNAPAESYANAANAAPAAAAPAPPPSADAERKEQAALAKTTRETGMLVGGAAPAAQAAKAVSPAVIESAEAARHRVRLDARLYPESWILKIRSRLSHGDTAGARASLRLFIEHYPQESVPANLEPLLDQ